MLKGKKIIYGITGSIAAIKAPIVARELMRARADVHCVLTEPAEKFVTAYSLSVLTKNEVHSSIFPTQDSKLTTQNSTWHIHLGRSADAMFIAPCSATTIGKLRYGIYDNPVLLAAASLSDRTPLVIAPAMDEEMWLQPAVQENLEWLMSNGVYVIDPVSGELASGASGMGRMPEPDELVKKLEMIVGSHVALRTRSESKKIAHETPLAGKKILVTGGPTYEPIDPVRFIGNRSSGKMGAALAEAALNDFGASVTLVMGPSSVKTSEQINRIDVETAEEMRSAVTEQARGFDIIIMSAAVSDYRAKEFSKKKLKKSDEKQSRVELEPTEDILKEIASLRKKDQILVGFALESSERGEEYAKRKLEEKSLDMIVLNHYDEDGAGFSSDTNHVAIFFKHGKKKELPKMTKRECAVEILSAIAGLTT
jgi:phosphopantothenoylcysteine decarboxylase/phosphopantothenate--cysteine ligase